MEPFPPPHNQACDEIRRRTGLMPSPHYGAGKLRWCLDEYQEVQAAATEGRLACGPLASFLLFRLVRDRPFLVDPANGCRTLLWNLAAGDWDPDLLEWAGIPREVLPDPVPTLHRTRTSDPARSMGPMTASTLCRTRFTTAPLSLESLQRIGMEIISCLSMRTWAH